MKNDITMSHNKNIIGLIIYLPAVYLVYMLLFQFGVVKEDFLSQNLLTFDANWYHSIVKNGYIFVEGKQCNVAFYPLFPFIWKLLHFTPALMSIFNGVIFLFSAWLFSKHYQLSGLKFWMLLSTPTLIFCFIPYSESIFFLCCTICLIGLKNKNIWWVLGGALLLGITRSVMVFFIPACIYMILFYFKDSKKELKVTFLLLISTIVTFVIITVWQYLATGLWFTFFKAQEQWAHFLQIPQIPFYSWRRETLWEDLQAMTIALIFSVYILQVLFNKVFGKKQYDFITPDLIFSLLNIAGVGLFILFFQKDNFHSLNRYVFCTPFFWVVAINVKKTTISKFSWPIVLLILILLCNEGLFSTNFKIGKFITYTLVIALLFTRWLFWVYNGYPKAITILLIVIGFVLQIHLLHIFLCGGGIG